jgi:hypothetical protein
MTSNYILQACTFDFLEGYAARWENCVEIGTSELWGSLETTSFIYATYGASVGLAAGQGRQIGACDDLEFAYSRDMSELEIGNVVSSGVYELDSEEVQLTLNMFEWQPQNIAFAFNTTYSPITATDGLIQFGGGCVLDSRPIVVYGTNISCNADDITDLTDGVDYMCLTLYDCYSVEGATLPITANENNPIPITIQARPVLSMAPGTRLGNLVLATD